ncbi:MAG: DUF4384 domain-containing protein [Pseudomonadota bacterium]
MMARVFIRSASFSAMSIALAVCAAWASPLAAQNGVPPRPAEPAAAAAYDVLAKHCARCHQSGKLKRKRPAKAFGNILDLAAIQKNPQLVRPGNPDASVLYTIAVKGEMPFDVFQAFKGGAAPTADEWAAVRRWIEKSEPGDATALGQACAQRTPLDLNAITKLMAAHVEAQPPARRATVRFITLTHLHNACDSADRMQAYRQAVTEVLRGFAPTPEAAAGIEAIDPAGTIIAFDMERLGWGAEQWQALLAAYPYGVLPDDAGARALAKATATPLPYLRGDWLAHDATKKAALKTLLRGARDPQTRALQSAGNPIVTRNGVNVVEALARRYAGDVELRLAAAEVGLTPRTFLNRLDAVDGDASVIALKPRFQQALVPRALMEELFELIALQVMKGEVAVIGGETFMLRQAGGGPTARSFDLTLSANRAAYRRGDLAVFTVRSSRACHLTLINIDTGGRGTVIYPNDFARRSLIKAGETLQVPAKGARYRFRLRDAGTERIVAVCNVDTPSADGITHDFEKQRFTDLGNYARFLDRAIAADVTGRRSAKERGRRGRAPRPPELQARTAIMLPVE